MNVVHYFNTSLTSKLHRKHMLMMIDSAVPTMTVSNYTGQPQCYYHLVVTRGQHAAVALSPARGRVIEK